jgi:endoglucanase
LVGVGSLVLLGIRHQQEEKCVSGVKCNGNLRVEGAKIVNQHGKEVQLRGVSTHGLQWFGELYTREMLEHLKSEMNIDVFRIALYVEPGSDGYIKNPELKQKVFELVDWCQELDIYAIIDWHILNEQTPQKYKAEALEFFAEASERYAEAENVIYEICNEPNSDAAWEEDVRPYAEEVIVKIREHNPKALVIVGTPDWSKDLRSVARNPLEFENVAYALHFYAGSHNKLLRDEIDAFREKGLAVFVSECGATDATGDGKLYDEAFGRWKEYLDANKISWVYWSLSNKKEASAMLVPEFEPEQLLAKPEGEEQPHLADYLSDSGKIIYNALQREE